MVARYANNPITCDENIKSTENFCNPFNLQHDTLLCKEYTYCLLQQLSILLLAQNSSWLLAESSSIIAHKNSLIQFQHFSSWEFSSHSNYSIPLNRKYLSASFPNLMWKLPKHFNKTFVCLSLCLGTFLDTSSIIIIIF